MSQNTRRTWTIAGVLALLVFAGTVWPTLHRYWKLEGNEWECLLRQNRVTGEIERLCTVSMDKGWVELNPENEK